MTLLFSLLPQALASAARQRIIYMSISREVQEVDETWVQSKVLVKLFSPLGLSLTKALRGTRTVVRQAHHERTFPTLAIAHVRASPRTEQKYVQVSRVVPANLCRHAMASTG
jgi:hypothetical protein